MSWLRLVHDGRAEVGVRACLTAVAARSAGSFTQTVMSMLPTALAALAGLQCHLVLPCIVFSRLPDHGRLHRAAGDLPSQYFRLCRAALERRWHGAGTPMAGGWPSAVAGRIKRGQRPLRAPPGSHPAPAYGLHVHGNTDTGGAARAT